jgi:stage IV sporulation protein FB
VNGGLDFVLAGVPVRVLWTFFIVSVLMGSFFGTDLVIIGLFVVVFFVSILLHELGHAFAYAVFGVRSEIVLHGFGGLTFGRSLNPGKNLLVSLAGPVAGLTIGIPLLLAEPSIARAVANPTVVTVIDMLILVNVLWALLNLLPILPLDGGNALNSFLGLILRRDTTQAVRIVSIVTAGVGAAFAVKYQYWFAALLAGWYIWQNAQAFSTGRRSGGGWKPTITRPAKGAKSAETAPTQSLPPLRAPTPTPTPTPTTPPSASPDQSDGDGSRLGPWRRPDQPDRATAPAPPADSGPGASQSPPAPSSPDQPQPRPAPVRGERTFAHEIDAASRALSRGEPELALIAISRAERMAQSADEHTVVTQLQIEADHRLANPG